MPTTSTALSGFTARLARRLHFVRSPSFSASSLLLALCGVLVMPGAVTLAILGKDIEKERVEMLQTLAANAVEDVADNIDSEILAASTLLDVFARSGWLEDEELDRLHRRARTALLNRGLHLIVLDESGRQLLNTRVPYATPLGITSDPKALDAARGGPVEHVSDFFFGKVAQAMVYNVVKAADYPDGRRRILILTRNGDTLVPLAEKASQAGWTVELRDTRGQPAFRHGPDLVTESPCSVLPSESESDLIVATGRPELAPWNVCVWGRPTGPGGAISDRRLLLGFSILWMGLSLLAALALGRHLAREIHVTAQAATNMIRGNTEEPASSIIREVSEIRSSISQVAAQLRDREAERRIILRETAHRAKNQMALAISLANLSARNAEDVTEMKDGLVRRLTSLSRAVDLSESAHAGATGLRCMLESQIATFIVDEADRAAFHGPDLRLQAGAAQSLALVFHELATNACKHGGWSVPGGRVEVTWSVSPGGLDLLWRERGVAAEESGRTGFGSTLIRAVVELGFGGTVERRFESTGFSCRLILPRDAVLYDP